MAKLRLIIGSCSELQNVEFQLHGDKKSDTLIGVLLVLAGVE